MTEEKKEGAIEVPAKFKDIVKSIETMSVIDLHELVKLAPRRLSVYHVTLPTMVYRLLTEDLSDILIEIDKQFPVETEADERIVDIGNI